MNSTSREAAPGPQLRAAQHDPSLWNTVSRFYERRGRRLAWVEGGRFGSRCDSLIRAIERSPRHGLDPEAYDLAALKPLCGQAPSRTLQQGEQPSAADSADLKLTYAFLRYASHLLQGRLDPQLLNPLWEAAPRTRDLLPVLEAALAHDRVLAALEELAPKSPGYEALIAALARYRAIAASGGWPTIPMRGKGTRVAGTDRELLARRLDVEGDLGATDWAAGGGDAALAAALQRFQRRHGLSDDGALDERTVAALNVTAAERVRQIELNLERWRWLPESFGSRYVLVNIPDFTLKVVEDGHVRLSMRAVVGKQAEPTPVLNDRMTEVIFSPYWNVPERIAREEVLPALLKDPNYLESQNLEMLRVGKRLQRVAMRDLDEENRAFEGMAFRQRPGSGNVMGDVKFAIPNRFDVYLHDTPDASSFAAEKPAFSHGCIRVEKPAELAQYVLGDKPYWTAERVRAAMSAGRQRSAPLSAPLPVHIVYWTAWVEPDGAVNFRNDVYGQDEAQQSALDDENRDPGASSFRGPTPKTLVRSPRLIAARKDVVGGPL